MAHILVHIVSGSEHLSTGHCTRQVQFLSTGAAEVLSTYTLAETGSRRSLTAYVQIPTTPFRVRFIGCDTTGFQAIRRTTVPISPSHHAVELVLVGSETISTGVVRATFALSNFGAVNGTYSLQVPNPPANTSATVSSFSLVVDAGTSKQFQVNFTVSGTTTASPQFTVQAVGVGVVAKYKYTYLEDARLARVLCTFDTFTVHLGGIISNGNCSVTNLGPGDGDFTFTVSGGPSGFSATVSPTTANVDELAEVSVNVAVSAPSRAPVNTTAVFQVTAQSGRMEAGSGDIVFKVQVREIETTPINRDFKLFQY